MLISNNPGVRRFLAGTAMAVLLSGVAAVPRAQTSVTITFPSRLPTGPDYATDVLADPWDMSNVEDVSPEPFESPGFSNFAVSGGLAGGTTILVGGAVDSAVSLLHRGFYSIINPGRNGRNFPIDTSKYRKLAFRISDTRGGEDPQVYWFHNPWNDPAATDPSGMGLGVKFVPKTALGYKIIVSDMTAANSGVPWTSGPVRGFRIDPNSNNVGQDVFLDWVRLTAADGAPGAAMQTITWTGGPTTSIDVIDAGNTVLSIATGLTGSSYNWNYGILPSGNYTLRVSNSAGTGTQAFGINSAPIIQITDPDETGGEDYATAVLGNAWDMDSASDVVATANLTNVSFTGGQLNATNTNNDPGVTLLNETNNSVPIDGTKYRFLTYKLKLDCGYDLAAGSVARIFWDSSTFFNGTTATTTKDIIVWNGMNSYTIDLASLSVNQDGGLESSGAAEAWTSGSKRHVRLDPHEFPTSCPFHVDDVRLAAMDQADGSFTIRWNGTDEDPLDAPTVTLYYDNDTNPTNGKTQIVSGVLMSAGQYTWSTGSVTPGIYYIYAEANDLFNTYGRYSTAPVQVNSPVITPDPLMRVETPPGKGPPVIQPIQLAGWAIDRGGTSGTGVDAVQVWAYPSAGSPVFLGAATYFGRRDDVGGLYGTRFTNSGYSLVITGLPPDTYWLVVSAHSTVSGTFNQSRTVMVTIPASRPRMSLESPVHGTTVSSPVTVSGWAIDLAAPSGTGVDRVDVYAFPSGAPAFFLGFASYGGTRSDIGAEFGSQFTNSGFFLQASLAPGYYTIAAYPRSAVDGAFNNQSVEITVSGPPSNPAMSFDTPPSGARLPQPFNIAGWAIDRGATSGTGVDTVHVWAFPVGGGPAVFVGVAAYGASRADVGAVFGRRFTNGSYNVTASGLAPGVYDIVVFAHSTVTGTFNNSQGVRMAVQ